MCIDFDFTYMLCNIFYSFGQFLHTVQDLPIQGIHCKILITITQSDSGQEFYSAMFSHPGNK